MSLRGFVVGLSALLLLGCASGATRPELYLKDGQSAEEWTIREGGLFRDPGPLDPARNIAGLSLFKDEWWDPSTHVGDLRLDPTLYSGLHGGGGSEMELSWRQLR